jgi:acyl transferase domain-containing protein
MTRPVAVLFCPGRGSYGQQELGTIGRLLPSGAIAAALEQADRQRRAAGLPAVSELDAAAQFKPGLHLDGRNAADLIYFATVSAVEALRARFQIVAVAGNSLGWYTALAVAGALAPIDGWRLVATMARLQQGVPGGQVLTTAVGDDWRPDPAAAAAIAAAVATTRALGEGHYVQTSIRLGGHEVIAGTDAGLQHLLRLLPKRKVGEREFPFRLAGHGPFHTPLCQATAARAADELADLSCTAPQAHLIDGFGNVHTPWSAEPQELLRYTTGPQVVETFDFSAAVRTALREFNPDVLCCAPPGTSLRAPIGHVVLREGYRGLRSKEALFASGLIAS